MRKAKNIAGIVSSIILVLCLVAVVCAVYFSSGGFTRQNTYVQLGSTEHTKDGNVTLQRGRYTYFYVKTVSSLAPIYDVRIVPNLITETNFDFKVNGETASYGAVPELSEAFRLSKGKDYFTVYISPDVTMAQLLGSKYDSVSDVPSSVDITELEYFTIVVTPTDSTAIELSFKVGGIDSVAINA